MGTLTGLEVERELVAEMAEELRGSWGASPLFRPLHLLDHLQSPHRVKQAPASTEHSPTLAKFWATTGQLLRDVACGSDDLGDALAAWSTVLKQELEGLIKYLWD